MSGHSKWHNIQGRKGKQDAIRSSQFTKIGKLIAVAARGGGDPASNFSLRIAIDKAKEIGMPKDNVDRAIKRGAGELTGAQIEEVLYEGYGPGGVAVIIKTLTDNKNRTVSDVKHLLSEAGGSMAGAGSVMWMFELVGTILVKSEKLKAISVGRDEFELALIDAGADDIKDVEDDQIEIKTRVENFQKVLNKIKEIEIEQEESGLIWEAKDKVPVSDEVRAKLEKLFGTFEENGDIEDYYTNAE